MLKRELGLAEGDIVDIPQLFSLKGAYAEAFFPDMVRVLRSAGSWQERSSNLCPRTDGHTGWSGASPACADRGHLSVVPS